MVNFDFDEYCCGCSACYSVCPTGAITMKRNNLGFLIPEIDASICVKCNKCEKSCPHMMADKRCVDNTCIEQAYIYSSNDEIAMRRSASGAAFYEIAKAYMERHSAKVCGCVWNSELKAQHIIIDDKGALYRMQGSKYVQSYIGESFKTIIDLLKQGNYVLFSGTPCQCNAICKIIDNQREGNDLRKRLLTVAIICHGVSSPDVWESYKSYENKKHNSYMVAVNFRDKSKEGYNKTYCKMKFASGEVKYTPTYLPVSKFIESTIVYNLGIRRSCSHCDCKGISEETDLIIGDWFSTSSIQNSLGASCVVACTRRGQEVVNNVLIGSISISYEDVIEKNSMIFRSTNLGNKYNQFMEHLNDDNFWEGVERYYPKKYIVKKVLVKTGIYDLLKSKR